MTDTNGKRLRALEGLGYCGAVMILASILGDSPVLSFFFLGGIAIELIVIVRLLINIATSLNEAVKPKTEPVDENPPNNEKAEEITR